MENNSNYPEGLANDPFAPYNLPDIFVDEEALIEELDAEDDEFLIDDEDDTDY